jgi:WG containing repeat
MKLKLLFLSFSLSIFNYMVAQQNIEGTYNKTTKVFTPYEEEYWIDLFEAGIARAYKDGWMGLIDSTGKILCPISYDIIHPFEGNVAKVGKENKLALVNKNGKIITPFMFSTIYPFVEDIAIFRLHGSYEEGYVNKEGIIIAKNNYHNLTPFHNGFGRYQRADSFGIINKQGKETHLFTQKEYPGQQNKWSPYPISETERFYGSYPQSYKYLSGEAIELLQLEDGLAPIVKVVDKKIKFGFVDTSGSYIVPLIYDSISNFSNGFASFKKGKHWGVMNTKGEIIIKPTYDKITVAQKDFFIVTLNSKYGLINTVNQQVIPIAHPFIRYLFADLYTTFKEENTETKEYKKEYGDWGLNGKWGVLNSKNEWVLTPEYDRIENINNIIGKAVVISSKRDLPTGIPRYIETASFYLLNANGIIDSTVYTESQKKIGLTYDNRGIFNSQDCIEDGDYADDAEGLLSFQKIALKRTISLPKQKYINLDKNDLPKFSAVVLNKYGQKIFEIPNAKIGQYKKGFAVIEKTGDNNGFAFLDPDMPAKGKQGLINKNGVIIIPTEYDDIGVLSYYLGMERVSWRHNVIPVYKNEKWGIVNENNEVVVPIQYRHLMLSYSGVIVADYVRDYTKYGFYDVTGKTLLPMKYGKVLENFSGLIHIEDERGKQKKIYKSGKVFTSE